MDITPDDEMYRVDAVWLGPPKATFPWRARYVAYGVGTVVFLITLTAARAWFDFGFFVVAWSVVIAVGITRKVGKKITHERPLRDVGLMAVRELTTPRQATTPTGGAATVAAVRVQQHRPRCRPKTSRFARRQESARG